MSANEERAYALNKSAWDRYVNGQADERALEDVREAIELDPAATYKDTEACILVSLGDFAGALKRWQEALEEEEDEDEKSAYLKNLYDALSTVFISYRFDSDEELAQGLIAILRRADFKAVTARRFGMGSIQSKVKETIKRSFFFVTILPKGDEKVNGKFTAPTWLIAEASEARAYDRPVVIMVESGVDDRDLTSIRGELESVDFNRNNFTLKCDSVVDAIAREREQILDEARRWG